MRGHYGPCIRNEQRQTKHVLKRIVSASLMASTPLTQYKQQPHNDDKEPRDQDSDYSLEIHSSCHSVQKEEHECKFRLS